VSVKVKRQAHDQIELGSVTRRGETKRWYFAHFLHVKSRSQIAPLLSMMCFETELSAKDTPSNNRYLRRGLIVVG
jgi:hypothetical protein